MNRHVLCLVPSAIPATHRYICGTNILLCQRSLVAPWLAQLGPDYLDFYSAPLTSQFFLASSFGLAFGSFSRLGAFLWLAAAHVMPRFRSECGYKTMPQLLLPLCVPTGFSAR